MLNSPNHHSQAPVQHPTSCAPSTHAVSLTPPADPFHRHAHVPKQIDESDTESAVDTQSDDPFRFDPSNPPVTAPLFLPQRNSGYDHRDVLPHHITTQLQQSRSRKPAQSLEPDAKRFAFWMLANDQFFMLSHDIPFGSECCKPVTAFQSFEDTGERANVLLTHRARSKDVR